MKLQILRLPLAFLERAARHVYLQWGGKWIFVPGIRRASVGTWTWRGPRGDFPPNPQLRESWSPVLSVRAQEEQRCCLRTRAWGAQLERQRRPELRRSSAQHTSAHWRRGDRSPLARAQKPEGGEAEAQLRARAFHWGWEGVPRTMTMTMTREGQF